MKTIAGKYNGTVITDKDQVSNSDFVIDIELVNQSIVSLNFRQFNHTFKLTSVIHEDEELFHLHVMDKFTARFHVQGMALKKYYKSGIHGIWNARLQSLQIDLQINEFNEQPVRFSFVGKKIKGDVKDTPLPNNNLVLL